MPALPRLPPEPLILTAVHAFGSVGDGASRGLLAVVAAVGARSRQKQNNIAGPTGETAMPCAGRKPTERKVGKQGGYSRVW